MSWLKDSVEKNTALYVLGLLAVSFSVGLGSAEVLSRISPPTILKSDYDELARTTVSRGEYDELLKSSNELKCEPTYKEEFDSLTEKYTLLESEECPLTYEADYLRAVEELDQVQALGGEVLKVNRELIAQIAELTAQLSPNIEDIADIDSTFGLTGTHGWGSKSVAWASSAAWREVFLIVAPYLNDYPNEDRVRNYIERALGERDGVENPEIRESDFKAIGVQLEAYKLVAIRRHDSNTGKPALFWYLTALGEKLMIEEMVSRQPAIQVD